MSMPPNLGCKLPPEGWYCSRSPEHEGPCAARPVPSRGSEEGLGKLLDTLISKSVVRGRDAGPQGRLIYGGIGSREMAVDDARSAVESYVSRLRDEIERRKEINHALVESNGILIGESIGLTTALASLKEQQLTPEEAAHCLMDMEQIPRDDDEGNNRWDFAIWKAAVAKLRLLSTSDNKE